MPEDYLDDDPEENDPEEDEKPSHLRKQISEQAKRAKEAEARAAAAERQLALRDSGLDLSNPQHAFFAENTNATTAEEIRAEAEKLGFLEPPKPDVSDEEVELHAQGAAIAAGADATGSVDPDKAFLAEATALGKSGDPYKVAALAAQHYGDGAVYED